MKTQQIYDPPIEVPDRYVGEMIDVLDLPPDQADAIFGKPFMDELRKPHDGVKGWYQMPMPRP